MEVYLPPALLENLKAWAIDKNSTANKAHNHRPLHSYMDRNERLGMYHKGPTFLGLFVTKPVVTPGNNRCQMKDLNKIFPEIPYGLL